MSKTNPLPAAASAESAPPAPLYPAPGAPAPALGTQVQVVVADGVLLINNETRGYFAPGAATPQTVSMTTLCRLQDGDLVLVP